MVEEQASMSSKLSPQRIYLLCLFLLLLSGAAALGHQLLWTRRLTDLLGASAESSVRVFSCFFCGLGLGAALAAIRIDKIQRPFLTLARLEIGIVLLSLPILFLSSLTDWIWPTIGPKNLTGPLGGFLKLFISLLLLVPPATLMGFGFPVVIRGVLTKEMKLARHGINLYAFNTIGGVVGLIFLSSFLLPLVGASWSIIVTMAINALIGIAFWLLHSATPEHQVEAPSDHETTPPSKTLPPPSLLAMATFSGVGIIAAEVAAFKMYSLVATTAFHTPTALLIAVISVLALSAWLLDPFTKLCRKLTHTITFSSLLAGLGLALAPIIYMSIVTRNHPYEDNATVLIFMLKFAGVALTTIGPALFFAGLLFPATLRWLEENSPNDKEKHLGWLLATNGLGGLLGAEVTYRLLLPFLGVYQTLGIIGLAYTLFALFFIFNHPSSQKKFLLASTATCFFTVTSLIFFKHSQLPHINTHAGLKVLAEKNGREGHLAVIESPNSGRAIILSNQYFLGSEAAKYKQERQAHLPLILHPQPRTTGFIGHATGMTPGAALLHRPVENITSVEIASSVVDAATEYFSDLNHDLAHSAKAEVIVEDGRTYFASCRDHFDVIEGDLFLPWSAGVGRLYSHEHFQSVHRALRPSGIFCQWLPMFQLTSEQFQVIANTFAETFPEIHLFRSNFGSNQPGIALVGFKDSSLNWEIITRRCEEVRSHNQIFDPSMRHPQGIAMLYLGRYQPNNNTPINTLDNLWLELDAAHQRLTNHSDPIYLTGETWLTWLQNQETIITEANTNIDLHQLVATGLTLSAWEYALRRRDEVRIRPLISNLENDFPTTFLSDIRANWAQWPGPKPPGSP